MKKLLIIAGLFIASVSAKAQPYITIINTSSTNVDFLVNAITGTCSHPGTVLSPSTGSFTLNAPVFPATSTTYLGAPVEVNDASWSWSMGLTASQFVDCSIHDNCSGAGVGGTCLPGPSSGSFTDCNNNTVYVDWIVNHNTPPDVTVTIHN